MAPRRLPASRPSPGPAAGHDPGGPAPSRARERRVVAGFGLVSLFSDLAHEAFTAVLPLFLATLGAPPIALGLVEGASDAGATLCKLWAGSVADRARRLKPLAVAGYVVTALAVPSMAWARVWTAVLGLRVLAWLGRGFRSPLRDTLLAATVSAERRGAAFGLERAMDQVGAVLAPVAVLLLVQAGTDIPGIVKLTVVPGVLSALAFLLLVPERRREGDRAEGGKEEEAAPSPAAGSSPEVSEETPLRRLLVALGVFGSGDFAKTLLVLWALGPRALEGGVTAGTITAGVTLYMVFNAVTVGAAWLGGRLSDSIGRQKVLLFGYLCGTAGAAVPAVLEASVAAAVAALALSGVLVGIEEAVERAWAVDLAGRGRRGRALGLVHAVNGVGDLLASALVGGVWTWVGPRPAFALAAGLMLAGTVLTARLPEPR